PHDLFASAIALPGTAGSANANNLSDSKEPGELDHAGETGGASAWYRWPAPANGLVSLDTQGSALDTLLAVYTGSQVGSLSVIASNHYAGVSLGSRVDFAAVAGTVYSIAVDGLDGAQWTFQLNWRAQMQPRFTALAPQIGGGLQLTLTGGTSDHYEIQTSSDLINWTTLRLVTNVTGTVQFVDPPAVNPQFYRAVLAP